MHLYENKRRFGLIIFVFFLGLAFRIVSPICAEQAPKTTSTPPEKKSSSQGSPAPAPVSPTPAPTTDANPINSTVISVAGVIISAIVAAVAASYSARQKSKEIETTYQQRLQDTYLQNARQYFNGVYVPINIALRNLADHFRLLQEQKAAPLTQDTIDYFREACREYERVISELVAQGADSFLTGELDEELQSFNSFLRLSMNAAEPVRRMVITINLSVPFTGYRSRYQFAGSALVFAKTFWW
jgi:hypothetical protein